MIRIAVAGFAILLASFLAYTEIGLAPDYYWHLKTGLDLIESGKSAFVDHYSYSMPGEPLYFATPVFDAILAAFYKVGSGIFGVQTLLFVVFGICLWVFSLTMARLQLPLHLQRLGMLGISMTFRIRNEPRPEVLGFVFVGLLLYLYFLVDTNDIKRLIKRTYLPFLVLMFAWTNVHTSSILGYAIGAALFMKIALEQFSRKEQSARKVELSRWYSWLGFGIASLLVGFLNFKFENVLLHVFFPKEGTLDSEISEFQPIDFTTIGVPLQVLLGLGLLSIILSIKRKRMIDAFLVTIFLMYAFNMKRMLGIFPLVAIPFIVEHLNWLLGIAKTRARPQLAVSLYSLGPLMLLLISSPYLVVTTFTSSKPYSISISDEQQPKDIVAYMQKQGIEGKIRNEYVSGGYLLYKLSEGNKVFIDGRANILYPPSFVRDYMAASYNPNLLRKELERYPADYVVARSTVPGGLLDTALSTNEFEFQYFGLEHALLSRNKTGRYALVSQVFAHPKCLDKGSKVRLRSELEFAKLDHEANSPLVEFIETALEYLEKEDLKYFHGKSLPRTRSDHVLRLIAVAAERSGRPPLAYFYLSAIQNPSASDRLAMADLSCRHNGCLGVEAILDGFPIERAPFYELKALMELLDRSHRLSAPVLFPPERKKEIEEAMAIQVKAGDEVEPDWCKGVQKFR